MTETEKMLAGKLYDHSADPKMIAAHNKSHKLCQLYNATFADETEKRKEIINKLIPNRDGDIRMQGPIYFDFGLYTKIGKNFFANYNLTVLDCCPVEIGDNVMIGPNCSILTPIHPLRYQDRNVRFKPDGTLYDLEYAKPIKIGSNCWIAGNVTIIGGVEIGDGCVIGAGSVVTKNIPPNSLAVGNPCKVLREITEADAVEYKPELF